MGKIEDLIQQLCPNGVEYQSLGDVTEIKRGSTITKSDTSEGEIPVLAGGQKPAYFHSESNREGETIVVAGSGAYAGFVSYWNIPVFVSDAFTVAPLTDSLLTKYCYYFLKSLQAELHALKSGGGVPHVYGKDVWKLRIPIPPLKIQREIVRILDTFTELEALLEAELDARKEQYEHYRLKLLSCEGLKYRELELGSFGRVLMCKRIMKNETSSSGDIPFYKIGTFGGEPDAFITKEKFEEFKSKYPFPKVGSLLISAAGTIGRIVRHDGEPSYFQDSNIVWLEHDESDVLNDYLFHCYKIAKWTTDTGSIPRLYNSNILKLKIRVPSLDDQNRIAKMLEFFEKLINDPNSGISAEIDLRRKQYEYYRSKLFTFKELEVA